MPNGPPPIVPDKNILQVLINKNNKLLVENQESTVYHLKPIVKEFFTNPYQKEDLPEKKKIIIPILGEVWVSKGIVSLKNDRGTSYEMYIKVQNEITAAINELRDEFSNRKYGINFKQITDKEKIKAIRKMFPMAISEAEPKNIGEQ